MATNMETEVKDGILIIKVDLSQEHGSSRSGKTMIVATSSGAVQIEDVSVNLNVYKKR